MRLRKAKPSKAQTNEGKGQSKQTNDEDIKVSIKPIDPDVEKRYKKLVKYAKKNGYPEL
jgi:effector-binding domain-containing protein